MHSLQISNWSNGGRLFVLNRPTQLNVLNLQLLLDLQTAIHEVILNPNNTIRFLIWEGSGKAFCAGMLFFDKTQV